jgi:hypothetical protein
VPFLVLQNLMACSQWMTSCSCWLCRTPFGKCLLDKLETLGVTSVFLQPFRERW